MNRKLERISVPGMNMGKTAAKRAEIARLIQLGVLIIEEEREIEVESNKQADGIVRDERALKQIRRYDRFLRGARKVLA